MKNEIKNRICPTTDFAILLGNMPYKDSNYNDSEFGLKRRVGAWWTKDLGDDKTVGIVTADGDFDKSPFDNASVGVRPVVPVSSILGKCSSDLYTVKNNRLGTAGFEVVYGAYPQTVMDLEFIKKLENDYRFWFHELEFLDEQSIVTMFTTDLSRYPEADRSITDYMIFGYKNNLYIRMSPTTDGKSYDYLNRPNPYARRLSDGRAVGSDYVYWVRIDPIIWKVDMELGLAISKKILFAGVPFHNFGGGVNNFEETFMNQVLNNHFANALENIEHAYNCLDSLNYRKKCYAKLEKIRDFTDADYDIVAVDTLDKAYLLTDKAEREYFDLGFAACPEAGFKKKIYQR